MHNGKTLIEFTSRCASVDAEALLGELRGRFGIIGDEFGMEGGSFGYVVYVQQTCRSYQFLVDFCYAWKVGRDSCKICLSDELRSKLVMGSETMHDVFEVFDIVKTRVKKEES